MKRPSFAPLLLLALLPIAGCGSEDAAPAAETIDDSDVRRTRARRDSAIAGSRLPGAEGVGRALDASETARRRAEATDTLLD